VGVPVALAGAVATSLIPYAVGRKAGTGAGVGGLLGWLAGNPNVGSAVKREADIKGEIDHHTALGFLGSLLELIDQAGFSGIVLVLDEAETLQRVRSDVREKSLNALRQLIDYLDEGR
ncbi:MAG: BREX system ATP-binding domain-containing protein, partial [Bradymonadaceae bacterium]